MSAASSCSACCKRRGGPLRRRPWPSRLLVLAALACFWCGFWKAWYGPDPYPDEVHYAVSSDGWTLALSRWRPQGKARRHPVLLCHGLGADRLTWDAGAGPSLARWLSADGWDVYALELRGHGLSEHPAWFGGKSYGWSFDDYLQKDLPAALDRMLAVSGAKEAHYIGHSMGGDLLYAYLASGGARLRSGTAVGSSIDNAGEGSDFDRLLGASWLTRVLPALPMGPLARFFSPFAGRFDTGLDRFGAWQANMDGRLFRRFLARGLHPVSSPVLAQLATAFEPGGLRSADGSKHYLEGLAGTRVPVLAAAGDKDAQCPPKAAARSLSAVGSKDKKLVVFGKEGGQPEHYGHVDLLLGKRAEAEVYPVLRDWLARHD